MRNGGEAAGDLNVGGRGGGKGEGEVVVGGDGEGAQLVAFGEDFAAGGEVNAEGDDDADPTEGGGVRLGWWCRKVYGEGGRREIPCWAVADGYTHEVPLG